MGISTIGRCAICGHTHELGDARSQEDCENQDSYHRLMLRLAGVMVRHSETAHEEPGSTDELSKATG